MKFGATRPFMYNRRFNRFAGFRVVESYSIYTIDIQWLEHLSDHEN